MRILNFILAAMFLVFAFVQINDPDPVVWILIYGAMAVICILAIFRFYPMKVLLAMTVALIGYSFFYLPGVLEWMQKDNKALLFDDIAKMQYPYIEEAREFLGLLICVTVLIFHLVSGRKAGQKIF
jgi:hypothetical protein